MAKLHIAEKESRRVFCSRLLVLAVLLVSALCSALFTYDFVFKEEHRTFQSEFFGVAAEIIEVGKQGEQHIVQIMEEFSLVATSTALALNMTWPYVILPDFERRASASRNVSGAYDLDINAICHDDAEAYEAFYEAKVLNTYNEGLDVTGDVGFPIEPGLFTYSFDENGPAMVPGISPNGPYIFKTHASPPPAKMSLINIDYLLPYTKRWNYMNETKNRARSAVFPNLRHYIPDPLNYFYQPIFKDFSGRKELVAFVSLTLRWMDHFVNIVHDDAKAVIVVLKNTCGQAFTYQINGPEAVYLGKGDLHDTSFDDLVVTAGLTVPLDDIYDGCTISENGISCGYSVSIYPSEEFRIKYETKKPLLYTTGVLAIFIFTSMVFILYDCLVQNRQRVVMSNAERSGAIVSSLFPDKFHDRLFGDDSRASWHSNGAKEQLQEFFQNEHSQDFMPNYVGTIALSSKKPIADLYPHATVLFADIEGFTSWSSEREPTQVFTLLESIYQTFDNIAERHGVFKVETVGDAYMAVAGVPECREDHAIAMTRFARDCVLALPEVVLGLERRLGPGTGDIRMRFGLHSGPVLAGVLRGDKARFQLFGDTVNTAARVENSGAANRVHMTEQTAELLRKSGMGGWTVKRMDSVFAKGKGELKTYWLRFGTHSRPSVGDMSGAVDQDWGGTGVPDTLDSVSFEIERLVSWNVEQLLRLLKQVVAARKATKVSVPTEHPIESSAPRTGVTNGTTVLDEVTEIITLPTFDFKRAKKQKQGDPDSIDLDNKVEEQLSQYITQIAYSYRDNPFHNFEHASHVAMSVNKLLSRIVAPDVDVPKTSRNGQAERASRLHDHTYGITSDPLTHFALFLSSLMHDADHRGVSNGQLAKEDESLAALYRNKSIAEQNSVDLCWNMLMDGDFAELRSCICNNPDEMKRFRQIIVNSVLATDIFDKELATLRKNRWDRAFQESSAALDAMGVNRRATIVIEHIIQASDVAHTMQHWHVYTKWNERLFREMYVAYRNGRSEKDPSEGWYKGEIWFFDCYVIPLAKKLENCGVFGVSSDEYLSYAIENRKEWEMKGESIVASMMQKYGI